MFSPNSPSKFSMVENTSMLHEVKLQEHRVEQGAVGGILGEAVVLSL